MCILSLTIVKLFREFRNKISKKVKKTIDFSRLVNYNEHNG